MNKANTESNCDAPTISNVDSIFCDGFNVIMELTKEEKVLLLKMWNERSVQ